MVSNLNPHKSILYCLEKRARFLGDPPGWDWILQDPVVYHFIPSLYFLDQGSVIQLSAHLRQVCKDIYFRTAAEGFRRQHYLKSILKSLDKNGIDVIPLKGAALVETHFKNDGLRPMTDIDILVRSKDFLEAGRIFLACGMQPKWQFGSPDPFEFRLLPKEFWPGELSFQNEHGLHVDLHQRLVTTHWFGKAFPLDMVRIWARSIPVVPQADTTKSPWSRMLSPVDMLAHSCLHLAMHGLQDMQNFRDVDLILRNLPKEWDWSLFLAVAKTWKIQSAAYHSFRFSQFYFDTPIPGFVIKSLKPNLFARWQLLALISPEAILENRSTLGRRFPALVKFALFDGMSTKLRAIREFLFPNRSWLKNKPEYKSLFDHWLHVFKVILRGD